MISCSVPIGQIEEQYILPNNNVNTTTIRNPKAEILSRLRNLRTDGMNCRYTITGDNLGEIFPDKSRYTIPNNRKNKSETPILIFFK